MKILNIATTEEGGAGIATRNLNEFFLRSGHNSVLIVRDSKLKNKDVIVLHRTPDKYSWLFYLNKVKNKIKKIMQYINVGPLDLKYFFFNVDESKSHITAKKILAKTPFKPDVVILHWISMFINSKTIHDLHKLTKAKFFWIMIDNAPLTGGCHYPWDCIGFHSDCANCPAIKLNNKKYFAQRNLALKKKFMPKCLELIAGSEQDYKRAQNAMAFSQKKIHKLLFPVDENRFVPGDKYAAKSFFGIESNKKVVFYGTISLNNIRKGGKYFLDALSILQNKFRKDKKDLEDFIVLVAGRSKKEYFQNVGIPVLHVGYLNEESLIKAYQAADVYVSSSVEDSGPLMINQSIMCGTPVVAFEIGVALDLVHTGKTGYRAKLNDCFDLAKKIQKILNLSYSEYIQMCENCTELGLKLCQSSVQIKALQKIFSSI